MPPNGRNGRPVMFLDPLPYWPTDPVIKNNVMLQVLVGELKVQDVQYSSTTRKLLVRLDDSLTV